MSLVGKKRARVLFFFLQQKPRFKKIPAKPVKTRTSSQLCVKRVMGLTGTKGLAARGQEFSFFRCINVGVGVKFMARRRRSSAIFAFETLYNYHGRPLSAMPLSNASMRSIMSWSNESQTSRAFTFRSSSDCGVRGCHKHSDLNPLSIHNAPAHHTFTEARFWYLRADADASPRLTMIGVVISFPKHPKHGRLADALRKFQPCRILLRSFLTTRGRTLET